MMIPHGQLKVETLLQSALYLEGREEAFVKSFFSALETESPGLFMRVLRFNTDQRYQTMIGYFNLLLDCLPMPGSLIVTSRNVGREIRLRGISASDLRAMEMAILVALRHVMADKWTPPVAEAWTKALASVRTLIARPTCMLHKQLDWVPSAS